MKPLRNLVNGGRKICVHGSVTELWGLTMGDSSTGAASLAAWVDDNIDNAVKATEAWDAEGGFSGHGNDRYVTGDVPWDGYDLASLVSMVADPASPAQVASAAGQWHSSAAAITQSGDDLAQSLTTLMNYWQGSAAQQANTAITNTANWISAVGATAKDLGDSVQNASGALSSAQATMPGNPTNTFWAGYNSAVDGSTAAASGGPVGSASGALVGGLTSMFGANADQTALKQQAVQTMQRYEQAAVAIDTDTPQFAAPAAWSPSLGGTSGTDSGASGGSGSGTASDGLAMAAGLAGVGAVTALGAGGVGLGSALGSGLGSAASTLPSFADNAAARWAGLTSGGGGLGGSAGGIGAFGGFGAAGDALEEGASGGSSRQQTGASGVGGVGGSTAESGGVAGRAGSSAVLEDVDGPGGGMAGTPGATGMGGAGRGGANSEQEYKRRIPFEEEPFTTGLKAVPPVIGANELD